MSSSVLMFSRDERLPAQRCVVRGVCSARVRIINTECPLFGGKNTLKKRFGTKDGVRCPEFRGGRFSEVANVLQVWDFQSVTRTLSALGSVSASRSVRSGRFYCIHDD